MSLFFALILRCWAQFVGASAAEPPPETIRVSATAYTCYEHPANAMTNARGMCEVLANGSTDVMSAGLACPRSWLGRRYRVEGFGVLTCDDTPRDSELNGLPHVDIRLPTYDAALAWGIREIEIREVQP